jgi:hypothetical protein
MTPMKQQRSSMKRLVCCPDERLRNIGKVGISSSTGAFSLM